MDAFYAAVEQQDRPELRGKPLLIGFDAPRSVVSTASYEARPFGVGSAMPMAIAKRKCPQALIIPPRMRRYAEVSDQIMAVFADFSPRVEPLSLDEAFLDMTGAEGIFGTPEEMARRLKFAVLQATGLRVSVGAAACKYVAKVASDLDKPDGLLVVPEAQQLAFLAPLPVSRLWGVGAKGQQILKDLGLHTIGQVADADVLWLQQRLGSMGPHIFALANAEDSRPVVPDREATSIGAEETLATDASGRRQIEPYLLAVTDRVALRLRRAGVRAGGWRVKLKTAQFQLHTRQIAARPPLNSAPLLYEIGQKLLEQFDLSQPMRLVGVAAFDLRPLDAPEQGELFGAEKRKKNQKLDQALDALRDRFGSDAVQRGTDVGQQPRVRHVAPGNKRDL